MSIQKKSLIGNLTAAKKAITAAIASAGAVEGRAKVSRGAIRPGVGAPPRPGVGAPPRPGVGAPPRPGVGAPPRPGVGAPPRPGVVLGPALVPLRGPALVPLRGPALVPLRGPASLPLIGPASLPLIDSDSTIRQLLFEKEGATQGGSPFLCVRIPTTSFAR